MDEKDIPVAPEEESVREKLAAIERMFSRIDFYLEILPKDLFKPGQPGEEVGARAERLRWRIERSLLFEQGRQGWIYKMPEKQDEKIVGEIFQETNEVFDEIVDLNDIYEARRQSK